MRDVDGSAGGVWLENKATSTFTTQFALTPTARALVTVVTRWDFTTSGVSRRHHRSRVADHTVRRNRRRGGWTHALC